MAQPPARPLAFHGCMAVVRDTPLLVSGAIGLLLGDLMAGGDEGLLMPRLALAAVAGGAIGLLFLSDRAWKRIAVAVLACVFGYLAADRVYRPSLPHDHVALAPMHVAVDLEALLLADPEIKASGAHLWLSAQRVDDGQGWRRTRGRVLLSVREPQQMWRAGDRMRASVSLRRSRNFGNPGEFDYAGYLARRGVYVTAFAETDAGFARLGHVNGATEWLRRWRRGVGALIERTLPAPQSTVLNAVIIGAGSALPRDLRGAFSRAGVSHVLAISGLHVGLVAAAGYLLFRWLLARSRWLLLSLNVPKLAVALSVVPVLLYAGIAGGSVATVRAVIMIVVFLGAVLVDRQRHLIVSLAVAASAIVLSAPGSGRDVSFQLSFVAVLGLMLAMGRFWPWWRQREEARLTRLRGRRAAWLRLLVVYAVVSTSAWAATMPLTAAHFNQISLVAPVTNALVVPLLGSAAVTLGLLAALAYTVCEPLARLCVLLAGPFVSLGVWLVQVFSAWPSAALRVVTPTAFELVLLYAALLALVLLSGRARAASLALVTLLALADATWWYTDRYERTDLRVTFLSVGQGDSAVVELPGSAVMVIDGGGLGGDTFDVGERLIAPFLWSRKIAHVDYLVLSHPQWDHYGGLAFVAENFSPREFWSNGMQAPSPRFAHLLRVLAENDVQSVILRRGDRRRVGAVEAVAQSPPQTLGERGVNDQSLVLSLAFAGTRLLFPGDIEAPTEESLAVTSDGALASAILKVPHHGSRTSSTVPFLNAVAPRLAIVSAGYENRFGFPDPAVLRRYAAKHCRVVRTDLDGAVQVRVGPNGNIAMRGFRGPSPDRSGDRTSLTLQAARAKRP